MRFVPTQRTRSKTTSQRADPLGLECSIRQLLADKVSGNQVGIWLLVPEHLRLGTWDLLCSWTGRPGAELEPRLALHLIHEAAFCLRDLRHGRSLAQKGFELANGLPFVPSDIAIHDLLASRSMAQSQQLQIALGKLRRASHHFSGQLLGIDPHRLKSFSQRQMRRHRLDSQSKPSKMGQSFFCLDLETEQPLCFTLSSSATQVVQITSALLDMAQAILNPQSTSAKPLVLADKEHFSAELIQCVAQKEAFDLLVAMPAQPAMVKQCQKVPSGQFKNYWPGYAIAKRPYHFCHSPKGPSYYQLIQRTGANAQAYQFKSFLSTGNRSQLESLTKAYPRRWHVEEFFKFNQALGWQRAGTLNLNVRYGQMTMALLAQAVIHQFRQRIQKPYARWDASHLARQVLEGLDGDVRVNSDTIEVTYYNAPNVEQLRPHYENLGEKLAAEGLSNKIPWLYNFKLEFRFK